MDLRHSNAGDQFQLPPSPAPKILRVPRIAFGIVPLTTPYVESDPDHRVLNAISRGLLFENVRGAAAELQLTRSEYSRTIRNLKNDGLIYTGVDGKYRLTFGTSNFPNIVAREEGI